MKIWKFIGVSSRQALRQVKEKLGPDALILSNRPVEGGVEMAALASGDVAALDADAAPAAAPVPATPTAALLAPPATLPVAAVAVAPAAPAPAAVSAQPPAAPVPVADTVAGAPPVPPQAARPRAPRKPRRAANAAPESAPAEPAVAPAQGRAAAGPEKWAQDLTQNVIREIQSMRGTLESQLAALIFADPRAASARAPLLTRMLAAGFSAGFARELLLDLPPAQGDRAGLENATRTLAARLATAGTEDEIVRRGGVYALIGPTGVGKTTTAAKIAARCVVRHGAANVALLTTDSYRIAAHEQLRIYGRLLGLTVHAVRDAADLQATLAELRNRHIVLIDTIGMSQRDRMVAEQSAMLMAAGVTVKQVLLLNATCSAETLHDVVRAYGAGAVRDCILTKADEAATLGAPLEIALRERLVVHYVANGQRVPEDLRACDAADLVHTALDVGASREAGAGADAATAFGASPLATGRLAVEGAA